MCKLNFKIVFICFCLLSAKIASAQFAMPAFQGVQYVNVGKVTTSPISNVGIINAVSGGTVTGNVGVIAYRGVCWSTSPNPTIANSRTMNGTGVGTFSSNLRGLASDKTYNVRAYAVNLDGTVYYGQNVSFTTDKPIGYLNYATYAVGTAPINSTVEMNNAITNAGLAFDSGVIMASTAVDYSDYSKLLAAGVGIPNNFDNFVFVASGLFTPSKTGSYTFTCEGDDAVDLYVNNKIVASQYGSNSAAALGTHTGSITLTKDVSYTFIARMKEDSGNEALMVYWKKPGSNTFVQDVTELKATSVIPAEADGKVYYDGNLSYNVYSNTSSSPNSTSEMNNLFSTATVYDSGTASASTLVNFVNYNALISGGVKIPNGGDNFAVSASGYFIPSESGNYKFTCEGDDAIDFMFNNVILISQYGGHAAGALGTHVGSVNLTAGVKYPITARMQESGGDEVLMVFWRKPSQTSGWYQDLGEISSN